MSSDSKPIPSGLGPVMPRNSAASRSITVADMYPHLAAIDYSRPDFRDPASELSPNEVYARIYEGARPKDIDRTIRTDADLAALRAASAVREELAKTQPSAVTAADGERLERLERLVARLGADNKQIMAKIAELIAAAGSFGPES
jgi:hypothetical protein